MPRWVTISDAAVMFNVSERTIWRRISKGILESKIADNRRLVKLEDEDSLTVNNVIKSQSMTDNDTLILWFQSELERKNEIIESLRMELKEKDQRIKQLEEEIRTIRDRSDTIVMKLAEELTAQRMLLGAKLPKRKETDNFLKRILRKEDAEE